MIEYYNLVLLLLTGNVKTMRNNVAPAKKDLSKNWYSLVVIKFSIIDVPTIFNKTAIKNKLILMLVLQFINFSIPNFCKRKSTIKYDTKHAASPKNKLFIKIILLKYINNIIDILYSTVIHKL